MLTHAVAIVATAAHQGSILSNVGWVLGGTALWVLTAVAGEAAEGAVTFVLCSMSQSRKRKNTEQLGATETRDAQTVVYCSESHTSNDCRTVECIHYVQRTGIWAQPNDLVYGYKV